NLPVRLSTSTCDDPTICGRRSGESSHRGAFAQTASALGSGIRRIMELCPSAPDHDLAESSAHSSLDSALMLSEWKLSSSTVRSAMSLETASVNCAVEVPYSPAPK